MCEVLAEEHPSKVTRLGMKDEFGKSGKAEELMKYFGLSKEAIIDEVRK